MSKLTITQKLVAEVASHQRTLVRVEALEAEVFKLKQVRDATSRALGLEIRQNSDLKRQLASGIKAVPFTTRVRDWMNAHPNHGMVYIRRDGAYHDNTRILMR